MKPLTSPQNGCEPAPAPGNCHRRQALFLDALILLALPILSGCATPALWKHTAARDWFPADSPSHVLATSTTGRQDVIVVFDQHASVGDKTKSRLVAWNLSQPATALIIGRHALRQITNACDSVQALPVFTSDGIPPNATSTTPGYSVTGPLRFQFTVHLDGAPPGPFVLPYSKQERRLGKRLALLPFAVATDAVIVGAVCCALAGGGGGPGAVTF